MASRAFPNAANEADLYETDFHAWTVRQAALLRSGDLSRADLANLAEEIETLGRSERAALRSAYRDARKEAAAETGLRLAAFPTEAPFTLAEVEDEAFLPNATKT